jgi:hypothetical protein
LTSKVVGRLMMSQVKKVESNRIDVEIVVKIEEIFLIVMFSKSCKIVLRKVSFKELLHIRHFLIFNFI